jgi:hypothetical protein
MFAPSEACMKNYLRKNLLLLFLAASGWSALAGPTPPKPSGGGAPPPPPDLPINDYIGIVVILSILYGFYVISYKLKTKTPR